MEVLAKLVGPGSTRPTPGYATADPAAPDLVIFHQIHTCMRSDRAVKGQTLQSIVEGIGH